MVLPNACLSLIVIDSRFYNCGIALICLPPCRHKVLFSPTIDGDSHFFAEEKYLFVQLLDIYNPCLFLFFSTQKSLRY